MIGRSPDAHVSLEDPSKKVISRLHAQITLNEDTKEFSIQDKSVNGFCINGEKQNDSVLKEGDIITFGKKSNSFPISLKFSLSRVEELEVESGKETIEEKEEKLGADKEELIEDKQSQKQKKKRKEEKQKAKTTKTTPEKSKKRKASTTENEETKRRASDVPPELPPGWSILKKVRASGNTAGREDRYFISPDGSRFRSLVEVKRFLNQQPLVDKYSRLGGKETDDGGKETDDGENGEDATEQDNQTSNS